MLIVALVVLSFLSLLGGVLLTSTTLDVSIGDNYRIDLQLLNLAEGGIEEARERLRIAPAPPAVGVPFVTGEHYSVFLIGDANRVLTLRSIAEIGKARKIIETSLMKSGFPQLPEALTLPGDPGLDRRLNAPAGIERMLKDIVANATETSAGTAVIGNVGNSDDYRVVVVNGDCELGPGTGYGVLVIRGRLTLSGNFRWNGLILVVGKGEIISSGGAHGDISGGVFVARTLDDTPEVVTLDSDNVIIELDRSETDMSRYNLPYRAIAVREF